MSSSEIETTSSAPATEKSIPTKRPNDYNSATHEKKLKLDERSTPERIHQLEINETGVAVLQDTLDSIDVTKLLAKDNIGNISSVVSKSEFDAFASYINKNRASIEENGSNQVKENKSALSQFFNTQVINQIDTAFDLGDKSISALEEENDGLDEEKKKKNSQVDDNSDDLFKEPLLHSFQKKLESPKMDETILDKVIGERSTLFENEKITSQYRQEVDNLFEQIEHSIFAMGTEHMNKTIPDKILDIIFSDDIKQPDATENSKDNTQNIDWPENTLINGVSFNASFGTVIKKALINNASKSVQPQKVLNLTVTEKKPQFYRLGPFYGLPSKVKDLVRQYKGIEELYGK